MQTRALRAALATLLHARLHARLRAHRAGTRRDRRRRLAAPLAIALLVACSAATAPTPPPRDAAAPGALDASTTRLAPLAPSEARPPFFLVEGDGGARLHVLGTIHVGPATGWDLSPEVDRAIDEAERFAMELDLRQLDEDAVGSLLASMVLLPPGRTIDQVIAPETARLLSERDALLARHGMPRNARVRFEPWYVAVSLVQVAAAESGYALDRSVEDTLMARIGERPLVGLETFEVQMRMMDELAPGTQDAMLRDTLLRLEDAGPELERLVDAWRHADRAALEAIAQQGLDELPGLQDFYDVLLVRRNARWLEALRDLLDDPALAGQDVFLAVGALHLVGKDGLEALFRDAGYRVARIH